MIVIVGGNARNVGKTTLVSNLIAATPAAGWIAVKISGHPHGDSRPRTPKIARRPATELFLEAGAGEAHLLHDVPDDRARLEAMALSGAHVIIEANRAMHWLPQRDAYLFVWDPDADNPKPRERWHLIDANWILPPRRDPPANLLAWIREAVTIRTSDSPDPRSRKETSPAPE